jgi:hypothetical protein
MWDRTVRPGYFPKYAPEALLHCGWGTYYLMLLIWASLVSSMGQSGIWKRSKFLWMLVVPLFVSASVGAIPLALWCEPKDVFLVSYCLYAKSFANVLQIECGFQCLLFVVPVISAALKVSPSMSETSPLQTLSGFRSTHDITSTLNLEAQRSQDKDSRLSSEIPGE